MTEYAALISAVGVLLGAVVGLLGLIGAFSSPAAGPTHATPSVTATDPGTAAGAPDRVKPASTPSGTASAQPEISARDVRWQGSVLVTDHRLSWDLDAAPVAANTELGEDVKVVAWSALVPAPEGSLGVLNHDYASAPQGARTGEAACGDRLRTHAVPSLTLEGGKSFCLTTSEGRIALLTVVSVHSDSGEVAVKVWKKSDDQA